MRALIILVLVLALPVVSLADTKPTAIEEDETPQDRERQLTEEHAQERETLLRDLTERLWWMRSRCLREDISRDTFDREVASLREDCAIPQVPVKLSELGTSEQQLVAYIRFHEQALTRAANRKRWQQEHAARLVNEPRN